MSYQVVEICAGAGGQALGLEQAGFEHALAVEIDAKACETLALNRSWKVAHGDVADRGVWRPEDYEGVDLLAGGVPCPPFSIAGRQLGADDERDLFAWAVEVARVVKPRALLLENVRGLSMPRFAAYRQHVLDTLSVNGYVGEWRLLNASDYGVPQLRPRFVLVALRENDAPFFHWPEPASTKLTVGKVLKPLMAADGWAFADMWARMADRVAPTIVGGSKKHGGADLGPTRAKRAWAAMGVDGMGLADAPPQADAPSPEAKLPRLTVEMVARLQGWSEEDEWKLAGRKTAQYRQVGNAFPPPLARAVGESIRDALSHVGPVRQGSEMAFVHDPVHRALRDAGDYLSVSAIRAALEEPCTAAQLERRISHLGRDFVMDVREENGEPAYRLGRFKAFVGQEDHDRHEAFANSASRSKIS